MKARFVTGRLLEIGPIIDELLGDASEADVGSEGAEALDFSPRYSASTRPWCEESGQRAPGERDVWQGNG